MQLTLLETKQARKSQHAANKGEDGWDIVREEPYYLRWSTVGTVSTPYRVTYPCSAVLILLVDIAIPTRMR